MPDYDINSVVLQYRTLRWQGSAVIVVVQVADAKQEGGRWRGRLDPSYRRVERAESAERTTFRQQRGSYDRG